MDNFVHCNLQQKSSQGLKKPMKSLDIFVAGMIIQIHDDLFTNL
jgi:hypothetical protein